MEQHRPNPLLDDDEEGGGRHSPGGGGGGEGEPKSPSLTISDRRTLKAHTGIVLVPDTPPSASSHPRASSIDSNASSVGKKKVSACEEVAS